MENTKYSNASIGNYGYWLENPHSGFSGDAWATLVNKRFVSNPSVSNFVERGARPAIEVLKSNIKY